MLDTKFDKLYVNLKRLLSRKEMQIIMTDFEALKMKLLLDIFVREGFINIKKVSNGVLVIGLKTVARGRNVQSFHEVKKLGVRRQIVSCMHLAQLQRREGGTVYYLINTDRGIMTSFDAIRNRLGGKILYRIV